MLAFNADGSQPKILASPDDTDEFSTDTGPGNPARPRGIGRPDQSADENGPAMPVPDDRIAAQKSTGTNRVRVLRILGHDPDRPGAVILGVISADTVAAYSLNAQTGRLKALSAEPVTASEDTLIDQQGIVRLTVSNTLRSPFPLHFEYRGLKGSASFKPLEQTTGLAGFSVSPENFFGERAVPLGFDYLPNILYYAANTGRNTFAVYSADLTTKQRGSFVLENPDFDLIGPPESGFPERGVLVFDRFQRQLAGVRFGGTFSTTAWVKAEWQEIQAGFEKTFPGLGVKIIDWDQAGRRFVVTTEGPADPGAIFIYDAEKRKLLEFARRAPWIDASLAHRTLPFTFAATDGTPVSGLLTVPRQPRLRPVPMVVLCPDQPWLRVDSDFQSEVQALAEMGFVVVQLNGRGAWGFGLQHRRPLTTGYDLVQVEVQTSLSDLETGGMGSRFDSLNFWGKIRRPRFSGAAWLGRAGGGGV